MVLAEPAAYSLLRLMPWQLGDLAPAELAAMLKGAREAEERQMTLVAWQTAHLLNMSGKSARQRVTVAKLLGRRVGGSSKDDDE